MSAGYYTYRLVCLPACNPPHAHFIFLLHTAPKKGKQGKRRCTQEEETKKGGLSRYHESRGCIHQRREENIIRGYRLHAMWCECRKNLGDTNNNNNTSHFIILEKRRSMWWWCVTFMRYLRRVNSFFLFHSLSYGRRTKKLPWIISFLFFFQTRKKPQETCV